MGFASVVTLFFLAIGSTFPRQAVGLELHLSSSVEHHRTAQEEREDRCLFLGSQWTQHLNNCYYISSTGLNWTDANTFCQEQLPGQNTAFLAELGSPGNSESDIWLMEQIVAKRSPVWLGAQDYFGNNTWIWQHSRRPLSLTYPLWGPQQPNNHKGIQQNCLSTVQKFGQTPKRQYLNDEICGDLLDYVCQYVLPPSSTE